jgi:hypothetical protein
MEKAAVRRATFSLMLRRAIATSTRLVLGLVQQVAEADVELALNEAQQTIQLR